jgi:predicted urease superfamily metal-dependent hydrolase
MFAIEEKMKPWTGEQKAIGSKVYERVVKHLDQALLKAYQGIDPSITAVSKEVLETEYRKFECVSQGSFTQDFFDTQ